VGKCDGAIRSVADPWMLAKSPCRQQSASKRLARNGDRIVRQTAQRGRANADRQGFFGRRPTDSEDCDASIRKAQRISRGEIGELAIGYMSALTHDFLSKALEVLRQTAPGIVVDCIEMDSVSQERALLEGRISVGILVPSDRPVLELSARKPYFPAK
jgi:DNA-binding transcriptional LysR family regulator